MTCAKKKGAKGLQIDTLISSVGCQLSFYLFIEQNEVILCEKKEHRHLILSRRDFENNGVMSSAEI